MTSKRPTPAANAIVAPVDDLSLGYMMLEQRIAFDAAMAATVEQMAPEASAPSSGGVTSSSAEPTELTSADVRQALDLVASHAASATATAANGDSSVVVFIDSRVNDLGAIAAAAPLDAEIIVLSGSEDGLSQIARALQGRTDIEAIHIVSHGEQGALRLGAGELNLQSMAGEHADELATIRAALGEEADILLYGCNVADGAAGEAFIVAFAQATGADVAASSDDTGAAVRGGDWDLETRTGLIEAGLIDAPEWSGLLAPLDIAVTGDPTLGGPGGTAYDPFNAVGGTALWTNAGFVGSTPIDIRATVVSTTTFNTGVNATPYVSFITSNFEDMQVIIWNGTATIRWEIFAAGTNQTVHAVGSPNFSIRDLDGTGTATFPALPAIELEAVSPQLQGLSYYITEGDPTSPSTLNAGVVGGELIVAGTINRNAETNSMVTFGWTEVSSWVVEYSAQTAFVNPDGSISARFYYHDGNGDFAFVVPNTTYMLGIDLDANNSTATSTSYQTTFTENGAGVPIVDSDTAISQHAALGAQLDEATVRLTNVQAGDRLLVNGSTALSGNLSAGGASFSYVVTTAGGQAEVVLAGTATAAQYQAALQAITFRNTSEAPSTVDRQIEVFVTNNTFGTSSNQALSTIHVAAVNDLPAIDLDGPLPVSNGTLPVPPPDNAWQVALYGGHFGVAGSIDPASEAESGAPGIPTLHGVGYSPDGSVTFNDTSITSTENPRDSLVAAGFSYVANPTNGDYVPSNGIWTMVMSRTLTEDATITVGAPGEYFDDHAELYVNGTRVDAIIGWYPSLPAGEVISYNASAGDVVEIRLTNVGNLGGFSVSLSTAEQPNDLHHEVTFTEGDAPVAVTLDTKADASDPDDDIVGLAIVAAGLHDGTAERVSIGGASFALGANASQTVIVGGTSFQVAYTVAGGFAVTRSGGGTMPQADVDTLLRGITYENTSEDPTAGDRTLTFTATDSAGATSAPAVATITVVPVNDAPVADNESGVTDEDIPLIVDAASGLLAGDIDVDGGPLSVTQFEVSGSTYSVAPGLPGVAVLAEGTLTVRVDGSYSFEPAANYNAAVPVVTYTVSDGNGGTDTATLAIDLTPVAEPISAVTPPDQTTLEDTPLTFSAANGNAIALHDPEGISGGNLVVRFEVPATTGTLTLGGTAGLLSVSGNGSNQIIVTGPVAAINAALDGLTFTPIGDWHGTVPSDLSITMTRPADLGFLNAGFEEPAFTGAPNANYPLEGTVPGWETSATDNTFEIWESGFLGVPAFEGNQFAELNAFQVSTLSQTFTPTSAGGDLTLTFAHRGRAGVDTMNVTAIDLGADGVLGGGDDAILLSQNYADSNTAWHQYQANLGTASGNPILLQFNSVSAAGGNTVGNFLDAISIYDSSLSTTASVGITVTPVADAVDDTVTTNEDTPASFNVVTGANGAEADNFENAGRVVTAVTQPTNGSVTFAADGTVTYTPAPGFHGADTFTYTVISGGVTETVTVTMTVNDVNDAPGGADATITLAEDAARALSPSDFGFSDSDNHAFESVTVQPLTGTGTLTYLGNPVTTATTIAVADIGDLVYTPAANANGNGLAAFTFHVIDNGGTANGGQNTDPTPNTITFDVTPIDDAPSGTDAAIATDEDTPRAFSAADFGFTDVDGHAFQSVTVSPLSGSGTLTFQGNPVTAATTIAVADVGQLVYRPATNANGNGLASFTFQVTDNGSVANGGAITDPTPNTITLDVTPVNDAPSGAPGNQSSADGQVVSIDIGAVFTDSDGEDIDFVITGLPTGLGYDPETGVISGTLAPNGSQGGPGNDGVYTVTVAASDGTAVTTRTFTFVVANPAPIAVADSSSTHENATQVIGDATPGTAGQDQDGGLDSDTLAVTAGQNANGGALPIGSEATLPSGAKLTLNADGTYVYKPNGAFEGLDSDESATDTFSYTISDGQGGTSTATVTITIDGRNDAPQAGVLPNITGQDGATVSLALGALFTDADGEPLTFTIGGLPSGLTFDPSTGLVTGQIDYSASQNGLFAAPGGGTIYLVQVAASDGDAEVTRTFQYRVTNPAPDARDDAISVTENGPDVSASVLAGNGAGADIDGAPDGDVLTVTAVNGASGNVGSAIAGSHGGLVTINADGGLTFAPNGEFEDLDTGETRTTSVTYTLSDGQGGTDTATVTFTVAGSNDAPVATDNSNVLGEDAISPATGNLLTSDDGFGIDSDPDNDPLIVTELNGTPVSGATSIAGLYGLLTINPDGSYSYALDNALAAVQALQSGETLTETFAYTIADGISSGELATNGSLEGTALGVDRNMHNAALPPNWSAIGTADTFNAATSFNGYSWAPTPDGGDFLHALDSGTGYREGFSQTLTGLTPGQAYTIEFSQSIASNTFGPSGDGHWRVTAAGQTFDAATMTTPPLGTAAGWQTQSFTFTATAASETITFMAYGTGANRVDLGIDGISIASGPAGGELTATANLTITISGANDAPVAADDTLVTTEDDPALPLNVITGSGTDTDADGDALAVIAVAGLPANVGTPVAGTSGGLFTTQPDGTLAFDPAGDFGDLAQGETRTTSVAYTVSDGLGGTDTATVTVTVTGSNDAPVVIDPTTGLPPADPSAIVPQVSGADSAAMVPLDVTPYFTDPDASDALTLSVDPLELPSGIAFDPVTGTFSGTPDHSASQGGPNGDGIYPVVVTATDPHGATVTTTVVFAITNPAPVARDDALAATENAPLGGSVLLDNGHGADTDPDGDALQVSAVDGLAANVGQAVAGSSGGSFVIDANGSYAFAPGSDFDDLATGETRTTSITYAISDGQGGVDMATVAITITGTNDVPLVIDPSTGLPAADPSAVLAMQAANDGATITPLDISTLFADPDASDALTFTATGLPPGLAINPATGIISGTLPADASQGGPYAVTITATDPYGATAQTTVTYAIANLPPVAGDDASSISEDDVSVAGNVMTDALTGDADTAPDNDPLTVAAAIQGTAPITIGQPYATAGGGVLTLAADGSYTFAPGTAYNGLDAGETATETITYTIADGNGGTDTALLVITIAGANDAPVVVDPTNPGSPDNPTPTTEPLDIIPDIATTDGQPLTPIEVGHYIVDPDGEPLTFALDLATTPTWLAIDPATGALTGTPPADASQGSNTGNPGEYRIAVIASDPDGASVATTVTLTIANLPPVAEDDAVGGNEDAPTVAGNVLTGTGADSDTAPDQDRLVVAAAEQAGAPLTIGQPFTTAGGGVLTLAADGSYTFAPGTAYNGLDAGETATETITYTISDGNGGIDTALLVITIAGANDAPVVIDPANPGTPENPTPAIDPLSIVPDVAATDGATPAPVNVGSYLVDPDGEPLTFTATGLPPGLSIDPATGIISGTLPADASQGGRYSVTVTATDPDGAMAQTTVTYMIANPAPVARDDAVSVGEDAASATGNVLTGAGADSDTAADHDPLIVVTAEQAGAPITIGQPFTTTGGGVLTLAADGSYTFVPGAAYNGLDVGETATETITYTVSDGNGGTDTALLVVTITGANDAPVVIDPANPGTPDNPTPATDPRDVIPEVATTDGATPAPVNVGSYLADPDGEPLTFTATGLPPGLAIDPATGIISGTLPADASQGGPYAVTITATDPYGATAQTTVTYAVANLPPVAQDDHGTVDRGQPLTLDVLANDRDPATDHDELRVIAATAQHGTIVINSDGTITYAPNHDYEGSDLITYHISDGNGGFAVAVVRLHVERDPVVTAAAALEPPLGTAGTVPTPVTADGMVLHAVEGIQDAEAREVDAFGVPDWRRSAGDFLGVSSFSIKLNNNTRDLSANIETFVRDQTLIVHLDLSGGGASHVPEWKVQRADGRPLPDWLAPAGDGILMGVFPSNEEAIDLRITAILLDGTEIVHVVRVITSTGEIQPLKIGRSGQFAPPPLWEQIRANHAATGSQIELIAKRLAAWR